MAGLESGPLNVSDRRETWLFSEIETKDGKPIYRRLKWNIVQYGSDPAEYLEPVNAGSFDDTVTGAGTAGSPVGFTDNGVGRMIGIRMVRGRVSRVHAFDDYDAATIGCEPVGI